ncbi:MAG: YraN family protein [Deltaproteobacteria bacterium]|nr:YraN family protein [Deltaproteobacteria bacterium]
MTYERLSLGKWGEETAAGYLQTHGMKIVERNYRTPIGEIDLIARHGKILVFVEVKTRRSDLFGLPQEAVGARKQRQIIRATQWYLQNHPTPLQPRFDVVAVTIANGAPVIEHIPGAFGL